MDATKVDVEVSFYDDPTSSARTAVKREADRLGRFFERQLALEVGRFVPTGAS